MAYERDRRRATRPSACFDALSWFALLHGDLDVATSRAAEALEKAGDDERLRLVALESIAVTEMEKGHRAEARSHLMELIDLSRATGNVAMEINGALNLSALELFTHEFEVARALAISALDGLPNDHGGAITGYQNLGHALVGLGRLSEAREAFAKALDLIVASGRTGEVACRDPCWNRACNRGNGVR